MKLIIDWIGKNHRTESKLFGYSRIWLIKRLLNISTPSHNKVQDVPANGAYFKHKNDTKNANCEILKQSWDFIDQLSITFLDPQKFSS